MSTVKVKFISFTGYFESRFGEITRSRWYLLIDDEAQVDFIETEEDDEGEEHDVESTHECFAVLSQRDKNEPSIKVRSGGFYSDDYVKKEDAGDYSIIEIEVDQESEILKHIA